MLTLNQIHAQIVALANAHYQIAEVGMGTIAELQSKPDRDYPLLWLSNEGGSLADNYKVDNIRLTMFGRVIVGEEGQDDDASEIEVLSDMQLILLDFLNYFHQQHGQEYVTDKAATLEHFTERTNDRTAGYSCVLELKQFYDWNKCNIPQSGAVIPPTVDGLTLYDFCDQSVIDRLTPTQLACLTSELCGVPSPVTEQINGVTIGQSASGSTNNQLIKNTAGTNVGTAANPSVVPNSQIQINGVNSSTVAATVTHNQVIQNSAATAIGTAANPSVIADTSITSSLGNFTDTALAESTYTIANVSWTDSDGSPESTEYGQPIVCTPPTPASLSVAISNATPTYGSTISVTATPTNFTPTQYIFFAYNGTSIQWIADQAGAVASWVVNVKGSYNVYAIAKQGTTTAWTVTPSAITVAFDADAQAFLDATLISDTTTSKAINDLVLALKGYSIWTKFHAIYPFVGAVSSTHKFNLKNPLDTDAAYRLTFFGGVTFSTNGIQFNATNSYADTFLNDNTTMLLNSAHISIYSRTNVDALYVDMGVLVGAAETNILPKYTSLFYPRMHGSNSGIANAGTSQGLFVSNRVGSTEVRGFQNGVVKVVAGASTSLANATFHIGRMNGGGLFYSGRQIAFASIGTGLTDTEGANMYTAVQAFQTTLSRQV